MPEETTNTYDHVGPVLQAGALTNAIVAAIRDLNSEVIVLDRGAYLRVLAPRLRLRSLDRPRRRNSECPPASTY